MLRPLILLLAFVCGLRAHTNLFLPGDAFFTTTVTIEELEAWKTGPLTISYCRLNDYVLLCGYLGYGKADIVGLTREQIDQLISVLKSMEKEGVGIEEWEVDGKKVRGFRLFLYNRECDLMSARIGLRYNEQWASFQRLHRPDEPVLYDEVGDRAILENWQSAEQTPGLKFTVSQPFANEASGERMALTIKAEDVKFVACRSTDIAKCANLDGIVEWDEVGDAAVHFMRSPSKK